MMDLNLVDSGFEIPGGEGLGCGFPVAENWSGVLTFKKVEEKGYSL